MAEHLAPDLVIEIVQHLPLTDTTLQVLTQVCSNWRQAIIGTPNQEWLQRAGPYGLDIVIADTTMRDQAYRYHPSMHNILDIITPFYKNWRTLQLTLDLEFYKRSFVMMQPKLIMLEELSLSFSGGYITTDRFEKQGFRTFSRAPRLKCVKLSSDISHLLPLLDYITLPYQRLTTLILDNVSTDNPILITQILAVASKLESARFDLGRCPLDYSSLYGNGSEITYDLFASKRSSAICPNLVELEIVSRGQIETSFVLEVLTAPALRELILRRDSSSSLGTVLEEFQKRSKAPLQVFHIYSANFLSEGIGLTPFLSLVGETLQELVFAFSDEQDLQEMMTDMTFPHYIGTFTETGELFDILLPNLKRLGIALEFWEDNSPDLIADVVASRGYGLHKDPRHSDPSVLDSTVSPGYRLRDWLRQHRLEELRIHLDGSPSHHATAEACFEQMKCFKEREVDALRLTWCRKFRIENADYWPLEKEDDGFFCFNTPPWKETVREG
ncbi:hypothetical protein K435DRAFT_861621 [Dendrothele bispora CBS 962.96]|uniref:F-box domain-containing protein n=1 Tax=Dendrothele bispora (strain CBS 962.96) TaxID=1314807 RepID=A0A4V4HF24_DENBC|nr:hypothetical protein K435DRAFT_861621 [Dendrothele bispora CBS 962.96]